ncbi:hypothetical protein [Spirillospora sp. CA-294931]|uniref:hypothetical protein n=1 Tax=Spirillospora sp. CA-294931 TaxID=3240042 RepID=UPI003D8ACA6B
MVFLGLILIGAAVACGIGVALDGTAPAELVVFGEKIPGVTQQWHVFSAGAVVAVVFILGAMLTFLGAGRTLRARRDLKYLREEHAESLTTLEMEKRRLQQELARVRQNQSQPQGTAQPVARHAATASRPQATAGSPFFDRAE